MTNNLEVLLSAFRKKNPCCKSVTVRAETVCLTGEMNCLTSVASFFTAHDLLPRRTGNGLEFSIEDLARAVEIYEEGIPAG
jgi:hypothetical protein